MRKNKEQTSVKRINKVERAELVYDLIFFSENEKKKSCKFKYLYFLNWRYLSW